MFAEEFQFHAGFVLFQTVCAVGKMRFNKSEVAALALGQPSHKFEKEGVLFVREKQEGFFRRSESESSFSFYVSWEVDFCPA